MTAPFVPRPPGSPAWWARPATAEEMEAVERERLEMETLLGLRPKGDDDDDDASKDAGSWRP